MVSDAEGTDQDAVLHRIARLEERVSDLTGLLQSLAVSAQLTEDEPFEAACVRHMITGEQRSALQMQIAIMLARKAGKSVDRFPDSLFPQYPTVVASKTQSFASVDDMAVALAPVVGSPELAKILLEAYEKRGLGR